MWDHLLASIEAPAVACTLRDPPDHRLRPSRAEEALGRVLEPRKVCHRAELRFLAGSRTWGSFLWVSLGKLLFGVYIRALIY